MSASDVIVSLTVGRIADNEWKTRYETQVEMNQQLEKQSILLQDKIVDARGTVKESKSHLRHSNS